MSERNDGGPAFARGSQFSAVEAQDGMSLRDWLAGQALAAMADRYPGLEQQVATRAYKLADALLAERDK
jgi:hypothetical protein